MQTIQSSSLLACVVSCYVMPLRRGPLGTITRCRVRVVSCRAVLGRRLAGCDQAVPVGGCPTPGLIVCTPGTGGFALVQGGHLNASVLLSVYLR